MQKGLTTVVIPCFNHAKVVTQAIESALNQVYGNVEVIIVDDGSTDDSVEVVRNFGAKVKSYTGPHRGGAAARNKGLAVASGEFVQFLDADDVLEPTKLQVQSEVLTACPEVDIVYSDWLQWDLDARGPRVCSVASRSTDAVVLALDRQNIQTTASLYRRQTVEKAGGFREDLPCCQERELNLRLAGSGASFRRIPGVLHVKRQSSDGVASNELRVIKFMRPILWGAYTAFETTQLLSQQRAEAFAALMAWQGRRLLLLGKEELAVGYFEDAKKMCVSGGLYGAYGALGRNLVRLLGFAGAEKILVGCRAVKSQLRSRLKARANNRTVSKQV